MKLRLIRATDKNFNLGAYLDSALKTIDIEQHTELEKKVAENPLGIFWLSDDEEKRIKSQLHGLIDRLCLAVKK